MGEYSQEGHGHGHRIAPFGVLPPLLVLLALVRRLPRQVSYVSLEVTQYGMGWGGVVAWSRGERVEFTVVPCG